MFYALHLRRTLGYDPLKLDMSHLPSTAIIAVLSLSASAKRISRFGSKGAIERLRRDDRRMLAVYITAADYPIHVFDVLPLLFLLGPDKGMALAPCRDCHGKLEESPICQRTVTHSQMSPGPGPCRTSFDCFPCPKYLSNMRVRLRLCILSCARQLLTRARYARIFLCAAA